MNRSPSAFTSPTVGRREMDRQDERAGVRRPRRGTAGGIRPPSSRPSRRWWTSPGSRHCSAWCIRSPVTTARWPPDLDVDAAMAGRVPGRRRQPDRVVQRVVVIDQQRLAGRDDRLAVEAPDIAGRLLAVASSPPPRRRIRACGRRISPSGRSAPSGRRAAPCSSRNGRCADGCRTRSRSSRSSARRRLNSSSQRCFGKSIGAG